jgi:hypothetical protein
MVFILAILTFLIAPSLMPFAQAQMGGRLVVDTDYEVYGLGNLDGGGHLTWTLNDDQASHLREKIVTFFENYTVIPPGFNCEGMDPWTNTPNLEIDSNEGGAYTDFLERYLENSCTGGWGLTDRYLRIYAADKVESQFAVERSTDGLVGSTAADTTKLQIRFIFNANTTDGSMRFPLAEPNIADAVHKVFDMDYRSTFHTELNGTGYLKPFNSLQGWHTAFLGTQKVLTTSYVTSPLAANNSIAHWGFANSAVNTSEARPAFASGQDFSKDYFDLRYAESDPAATYAEFEYVGFTAEAGDRLRLQVATEASGYSNWVNVNSEDGSPYFGNVPWPTDLSQPWPTIRFPLDMYAGQSGNLGQAVKLRLNFTSDGSNMPAPGFFIRNFRLRGDSSYHGLVEFNTITYSVSSSSFSGFDISRGSANLIRTPAGDILLFSISYNKEGYGPNATTPSDSIYFSTFDFFENAQITFALVVVAAYLIAYYQHRYFLQFKGAHPIRYRPAAAKIGWLHWVGRICIILLILFYFFPGIFTFAAPSLLISGAAMWVLGITFTLSCALGSKFIYLRQAKYIPPEYEEGGAAAETPPPPGEPVPTQFCADCLEVIESPANAYKCECGKVYHKLCASELSECPECHRKISVQFPKEKMITVQCPTCREVQQVKEGADMARTKCTHCDTVLRALDDGLNYLVIDKDPGTSYSWLLGMARREKPTLCMTTTFPEKVVKEYRLEGADMYWLSDTNPGPKTLDPKRLEFEVIRALSNFAKDFKGGAIILDGLEYLVVENGFDKTFKFIKKVNDLCSVHGTTFIVPITPGALGPDELTMLRKEFDRVEELAAPPPPPPPKKRSAPRTG